MFIMLTKEKSTYIIDRLFLKWSNNIQRKGGNNNGKRKDDLSA